MTRSKPITFVLSAAALPVAALAVAACGGGGAATAAQSRAPSRSQATTTKTPSTTLRVAHSSLGRILVNSGGRTLYLFKADRGTKSVCTGACATAWPPLLTTGKPQGGAGVTASKLGTTKRSNGSRQVTYNGHPLYLFIKDTKAGQTHGQGVVAFGAAWFALSPAGTQIASHPPGHSGASSPRPAAKPAAKPAAPPATTTAPKPAAAPTTTTAPKPAPPPAAKPKPPVNNGIPQNGGGDGDSDNNGGPSDGDGNI